MRDFYDWKRFIEQGRNKTDRPIANNTRAHLHSWEGEHGQSVGIVLHATEIITIYEDGFISLRANGWETVTTLERIRRFAPVDRGELCSLVSEKSQWYIQWNTDLDPEPAHGNRSIPKPFHAPNPGPEPQDDGENCIAGTREDFSYQYESFVFTERDRRPGDFGVHHYGASYARRSANGGIVWGRTRNNMAYEGETIELPNEHYTYKQCPHCIVFAERHAAWTLAMNGSYWGRNAKEGYRAMCENLEEFGSREAWQEAYIQDFRAARAERKEWKAWRERNRVMFYDGITLAPDGLPLEAPRPRAEQAKLVLDTTTGIKRENWQVREYKETLAA